MPHVGCQVRGFVARVVVRIDVMYEPPGACLQAAIRHVPRGPEELLKRKSRSKSFAAAC